MTGDEGTGAALLACPGSAGTLRRRRGTPRLVGVTANSAEASGADQIAQRAASVPSVCVLRPHRGVEGFRRRIDAALGHGAAARSAASHETEHRKQHRDNRPPHVSTVAPRTEVLMGTVDLVDPPALLAAANAGACHVRLDDDTERLVDRALETRSWASLSAASRALRAIEGFARQDGAPAPARVGLLLRQVRDAMRARRGASFPRSRCIRRARAPRRALGRHPSGPKRRAEAGRRTVHSGP
jgi:hypothetical protein